MTVVGLRERKRVDTRNRILNAASDLFREHGLDGVTVDEIAGAADVGKGTVYNYFEAKEDMVVAIMVELDRAALATLSELPRQGMSVAEALDAALWRMIENKVAHLPYVRTSLSRVFAAEIPAPELSEVSEQFDQALSALFERLLARPGMKRALPVDTLVLSFRSMHLGLIAGWALEGPPFAAARMLSRRHMALLAKGLEL